MNEVPKTNLTAEEIVLLRLIHGSDAVADIKLVPSEDAPDFSEAEIRTMLRATYGDKKVDEHLGADHAPRNLRVVGLPSKSLEDLTGD